MVKLLAPVATTRVAPATCASLYASVTPDVLRPSVSPLTAPVMVPATVAPVAAVVPSYALVRVPPIAAVELSALGVMVAVASAMVGAVKL